MYVPLGARVGECYRERELYFMAEFLVFGEDSVGENGRFNDLRRAAVGDIYINETTIS